jgi:hypothetical protein
MVFSGSRDAIQGTETARGNAEEDARYDANGIPRPLEKSL